MQRADVWWADLPKPTGRRPVLLLSRNKAIQVREYITVAHITRVIRNLPTEVVLGVEDGLPEKCVINLDVINTIPKKKLIRHISSLDPPKIRAVSIALKFALDLE